MEDQMRDLLHRILRAAVREDASDIYIRAGIPPHLRVEGELVAIDMEPLTESITETMAYEIMPAHMRDQFQNKPEANLVYFIPEIGRFRANIYLQRQTIAMVLRKVRDDILDLEVLRIPAVTKQLAMLKRGLVMVCGPTGSGKSTTLAGMLRYRNENTTGHIITIEDPIEYIHQDIRCILSQREVGSDTLNFADALESAVRQAPDVLLVGEMRDVDSVRAAVYFAETGHLVLSSLHSNNAVQAVERTIGFFPSEIHEQVLGQLSLDTRAIICQRLVPRKDGVGRIACVEIMIVNARMQELLAKGQLTQIKRELDQFLPDGMQSFDHSLLELVKADLITPEDAIRTSDNPNDMRLKLRTQPAYAHRGGSDAGMQAMEEAETTPEEQAASAICPGCREVVMLTERIMVCQGCEKVYHELCWHRGGNHCTAGECDSRSARFMEGRTEKPVVGIRTALPARVQAGAMNDEGLILQTAGGKRRVSWSSIVLLAVGIIELDLTVETPRSAMRAMLRKLMGDQGQPNQQTRQIRETYLLDLFVSDHEVPPLRVDSSVVNYRSLLGNEVSHQSQRNFIHLLQELVRHAKESRLDASAVALLTQRRYAVKRYTSVYEFEMETHICRNRLGEQTPSQEVDLHDWRSVMAEAWEE